MPRTARNIVEFLSDGLLMRAKFQHQHCKEDPSGAQMRIPVYGEEIKDVTGGTLGGEKVETEKYIVRWDRDSAVAEPLIDGTKKLRHITTCLLQTSGNGTEWVTVGEGRSFCSVKDRYNWRKGIKESLVRAIADSTIEQSGPVLAAFYTELTKRV